MSILLLAAAATVSIPTGSFDCQLDEVAAITYARGTATASMIGGLPAERLRFQLVFEDGSAVLDWPESPIQASGRQEILPTGPGAGMLLALSSGPCLFTQGNCATMLSYAQQPDGSLKILLTPTAVSYDLDREIRFPFLVYMGGDCMIGTPEQ